MSDGLWAGRASGPDFRRPQPPTSSRRSGVIAISKERRPTSRAILPGTTGFPLAARSIEAAGCATAPCWAPAWISAMKRTEGQKYMGAVTLGGERGWLFDIYGDFQALPDAADRTTFQVFSAYKQSFRLAVLVSRSGRRPAGGVRVGLRGVRPSSRRQYHRARRARCVSVLTPRSR